MESLRHRMLAWVVSRNPVTVASDDEHRALLLEQQAAGSIEPPAWLRKRLAITEYDGAECATYELVPADAHRTLLYLHGGGYVGHADPQHWRFAGRLAERLGARVVVPQYPVAPTHTWRDAHPPLLDLLARMVAENPDDLTLVGDSAGAGLALSLVQQERAGSEPLPARVVLISPMLDLTGSVGPADDPWLPQGYLDSCARLWAGGDPLDSPLISPLFGELAGLSPLLVMAGTRDFALPHARALVARVRATGGPATYVEGRRLLHDYPLLNVPEAGRALRQIEAFVNGNRVPQGSTS